jgi:hypothetical protein
MRKMRFSAVVLKLSAGLFGSAPYCEGPMPSSTTPEKAERHHDRRPTANRYGTHQPDPRWCVSGQPGAGACFPKWQQQGGAPGGAPAGQSVPKSSGQTVGQPAAPGGMQKGADTKGGKNAAEERGEQNKSNRAGEAQPNRNRETTGQAPQNERKETQTNERRENRTEGSKATNGATEERRLEQNRATEERGGDNDRNRTTTGQGAARTRAMSRSISPPRSEPKSTRSSSRSGARLGSTVWTLICRSAPLCPAQSALLRFQTRS